MPMKRYYCIIALVILSILPSYAQVDFGVRAGGAYSSLIQRVQDEYMSGGRFGWSIAGLMDVHLYKGFCMDMDNKIKIEDLLSGKVKIETPDTSVVVVAAGSASRMGGMDKQLVLLGGTPVLIHTLQRIGSCPSVREIIVVTREQSIPVLHQMVADFGLQKIYNDK